MRSFGLLVTVALGSACGNPLGPDRGDPAQYAFARPFTYACSNSVPTLPDGMQLGLFDIHFGVADEHEREDRPRPDHVRRVVRSGGTVVHLFNVTVVRAILPASALPRIGANAIYGVTDPTRLDTQIFVSFHTRPVAEDAVVSRGGTILYRYISLPLLLARMDDAELPALRQDPRVSRVGSALGVACLAV